MTTNEHALKAVKDDPLKPSLTLLSKLGSIAVHAEEMFSEWGLNFDAYDVDRQAILGLLADSEVKQWIKDMGVYMPVKR